MGVPPGLVALLFLPPLAHTVSSLVRRITPRWDLLAIVGLVTLLGGVVILAQLDFLNLVGLGPLSELPYFKILLGFSGFLSLLAMVVLFFPSRFSEGVIAFAKAVLLTAAGLLVTIIIITFTPSAANTGALDLKKVSGLPDLRILLGLLGAWGSFGLVILLFQERVAIPIRDFAKTLLIASSALLIAVLMVGLGQTSSFEGGIGTDVTTTAIGEQQGEIASAEARPGRGLSYRTDIWDASFGLIINRPWFDYEDLSLSFIRPLVGYGPEMFKYTFPLESPLGGLLSQAHNFFIHHWVEQGILGFLTSIGLFVAFFAVGGAQLLRNWGEYSTVHKWILITLLATMVGRLAETMVGVARESDLVLIWMMLAILVALPSIMDRPTEAEEHPPTPGRLPRPVRRQERRGRALRRRQGRSQGPDADSRDGMSSVQVMGAILVAAVVIFLGWLTWDKNVDYFWAGTVAANSRDRFSEGQFQGSQRLMSLAVSKAPDVPIYYHNLAGIYDAYRRFAVENPDRELPPCEQFFSLEPQASLSAPGTPYGRCAEESYLANLGGFRKNPTSPQAKLVLANSTLELARLGYVEAPGGTSYPCEISCDEEALQYYRELTQMIPWSLPLQNALLNATFTLGRPEEALPFLDRFVAISRRPVDAAQALYFKGIAYRRLQQPEPAIEAFKLSLDISGEGPVSTTVRSQLINTYHSLASSLIEQNKAQESLRHLEESLEFTQDARSSGTTFYLRGVAYRQLDELDQAAESFERTVETDEAGPYGVQAHNQLAEIYEELGDQLRSDEHAKLAEDLQS